MTSWITVEPRFRGPDRSANDGYVSGLLAEVYRNRTGHHLATVTLRTPPPLDTALAVRADGGPAGATLRCEDGDTVIAEVGPGHFEAPAPDRAGGVATGWTPVDAVDVPAVWAALAGPGAPAGPLVLAAMTAEVSATPITGQEYLVVGRARGVDGRKAYTSSALFDHSGGLLARAEATWIAC
jgi:hypothetical protein